MNRSISMLILAVVLLGMILIVINNWTFGPDAAGKGGPSGIAQLFGGADSDAQGSESIRMKASPEAAPVVRAPDGTPEIISSSDSGGNSGDDSEDNGEGSDEISGTEAMSNDQTQTGTGETVSSGGIGTVASENTNALDNAVASVVDSSGSSVNNNGAKNDTSSQGAAEKPKSASSVKAEQNQPEVAESSNEVSSNVTSSAEKAKKSDVPASSKGIKKSVAEASAPDSSVAAGSDNGKSNTTQATTAPVTSKTPVYNSITKSTFAVAKDGASLTLSGVKPFSYKAFFLKQPPRLVVDLPGEWRVPDAIDVSKNALVKSIRAGAHKDKMRIVFDLTSAASGEYDILQPAPDQVRILVR